MFYGGMALDCGTCIGYLGGQGHTLYEDWDSLYGVEARGT